MGACMGRKNDRKKTGSEDENQGAHDLSGLSVQSVQRGGRIPKNGTFHLLVLFYALYEWFAVHSINPREAVSGYAEMEMLLHVFGVPFKAFTLSWEDASARVR